MKKIIALVLVGIMMMATLAGCTNTEGYKNPYSSISLETIKDSLENADAYKNLTISLTEVNKQFESYKESLIKSYAEAIEEGVAVVKGDTLKINYVGILDGETEPFEGGSADNSSLEIGSGSFIDGFEDGLIGKKIGEKDIVLDLTFPKDYKDEKKDPEAAAKFNGKKVKFTVTVLSGTRNPEYNDALIKKAYFDNEHEYDNYQTVSEYEAGVKKDIYASLAFTEYKKLVKMTKYPTDILQDEYDSIMKNWASVASNFGMTLEEFASSFYAYYYMGSMYSTLDKLVDGVRSQAASTIKDQYLLRYVYLSNKEAFDKKFETEYDRIIAEYKHQFDEYVEHNELSTTFEKEYSSQEQLNDIVIERLVSEYFAEIAQINDDVKPTATPTPDPTTTPTKTPTSNPTVDTESSETSEAGKNS